MCVAFESIPSEQRVDILRLLAAQSEANYRKLNTWTGTYGFVDRFPYQVSGNNSTSEAPASSGPVGGILTRRGTVEFTLDIPSDKLHVLFLEDDASASFSATTEEAETSVGLDNYRGYSQESILTPSAVTKLPNTKLGAVADFPDDPGHLQSTSTRVAQRDAYPRQLGYNDTDEIIDPRRFFATGPSFIWTSLRMFADGLDGKWGDEQQQALNKNLSIAIETVDGDEHYVLSVKYITGKPEDSQSMPGDITRFSKHNDYLPVEYQYTTRGGIAHQFRSWEYRSVDGVLVPERYHYRFNQMSDGALVLDRDLRFIESSINGEVSSEKFSNLGLDMKEGERLIDRIENRLYVHDGATLVDASSYSAELQQAIRPRGSGRAFAYLMIINVIAATVVLVWIIWRRFNRSASHRSS